MNRDKRPWNKLSLVKILSFGFMVLGLGSIAWAMFNICTQPDDVAQFESPVVGDMMQSDPSLIQPTANSTLYPIYPAIDVKVQSSASPTLGKPIYPVSPAEGDNIGTLTLPALDQKLPIIQGTGSVELKKGVGHFTQSVLPGEADNCVLSGHRDTVFSKVGRLVIGDQLIIQTSAGAYTYEISFIRIVDKDDKTVIVPTDHAVLTLTTCYPFRFIGNAPDRYIITADLVSAK